MIPIERKELSIRKGPLYFVAAVFAVLMYVLNEKGKMEDNAPLFAAGGLLVFLFVYYMLSKNKLIMDNDGITQQLFFGKQKELKWHEISSSYFNWQYHGHSANLGWVITGHSGKTIHLQASFYSRKKIRLIAEALVARCGSAAIDKRIRNIAEGRFPWYIF